MTTHTDPAPLTPAMLLELARHLEALSDACRMYEVSTTAKDRIDDLDWLILCAQDVANTYRAVRR